MIHAIGGTLWKVYGSSVRFDLKFRETCSLLNPSVFNPKPGDAVLFHGGTDIWPGLYGESPISEVFTKRLLARDVMERKIMEAALESNTPMIGICRGAQHLCCFAGGSLFQHMDGHTNSNHGIQTATGEEFAFVPGDHHQVMRPNFGTRCIWEPLAWAYPSQHRDVKTGPEAEEFDKWEADFELEIVWFPAIRGLAIQPHPEWATNESTTQDFNKYIDRIIDDYILS